MSMTELENHLLVALHNMEFSMTARMDVLEKQMTAMDRNQKAMEKEVQLAHGLVTDLQNLWRRLGDKSND